MQLSSRLLPATLATLLAALASVGCASPGGLLGPAVAPTTQVATAERGVIAAIEIVDQPVAAAGGGAVAGGLIGGVLGNQVGNGSGRTVATIAGAVGGALLGHKLEERQRAATSTRSYQVRVRFDSGATQTFHLAHAEGWRVGDRVRSIQGTLTRD
ncbi:MAG TPA: glycine zipper 2TM domain-containing protein [Ramlibacter sp.]|jgi:outer membrane lipoprotein SlyB|nr:glycine zipper 2TM domain-containing protein [Ramlibacter sp.]